MSFKKVLSLGQCAMDHSSLAKFFQIHFQMEVVSANTGKEAQSKLSTENFALILVNRILDSDQTNGLDFIKSYINQSASHTPIMLISNYPEAHQNAVAAGAVQGFGKAELNSPKVIQMVSVILANKTPIN